MDKTDFMVFAIQDIQSTIRSIDVKVAALLVGIIAPLGMVGRVFAHLDHFCHQSPKWIFLSIAVSFIMTWLLALCALVKAIGAIDNPVRHVIKSDDCKGVFYAGGLYELGFLDIFFNREAIRASKDAKTFLMGLPKSSADIEKELAFEQMKLAYIRDMKLKRFLWGIRFSFLWILLGIIIFLSSRYLLN